MSDLVQRVERAMAANYTVRAQAKAAIREVLAAQREPGETVEEVIRHRIACVADDDRACDDHLLEMVIDAFARDNGLELPPP